MEEIDHEELQRRVAVATLEVLARGDDDNGSAVGMIGDESGISKGHVRAALKDWGFQGTFADDLVYTSFAVERVEAAAAPLRIRRGPSAQNVVNVHGGTGVQAAAGGHVSGTLVVTITAEDAFKAIDASISASALPTEKKEEVRGWLRRACAAAGETVLKTPIEVGAKQVF